MKDTSLPRTRSLGLALVCMLALFLVLGSLFLGLGEAHAQDGDLTVEIIAGYNLVVDSNVTSPSTYAPRVATVIGKFCNTNEADPLTDVYAYIGDYNAGTPGTYPVYDSSAGTYPYLTGSGEYFYRHVGPTADASRYIGTIPAGECSYQYWTIEYPACENLGGEWQEPPCAAGTDPLWGTSVKPDDDFSLPFDVWAVAGSADPVTDSWTMTMRNEISAMANKIQPNPDGRWFNTEDDTVNVGEVVTTNGILYTLGTINQGFDNDGDYVPDYNAWLQPLSQPDYDPTCFRLIGTSGVLTVTRSGGNPDMIIPFEENLYFTDLPSDNTGVRGEVYYRFLALSGPCSVGLSPYQEVASGFDNEKFNGDYGTGIPPIGSYAPEVTINKASAPDTIAAGDITTYTIPFDNTGDTAVGLTLSTGGVNMPLVISDTVPHGLQLYAAATYYLSYEPNTGATVRYSTDSGQTFTTTAPVGQTSTWPDNKIIIQWWLNDPLPAGNTGSYARWQAQVPATGYIGEPIVENTACIALDNVDPFDCDDDVVKITGNNVITGTVFEDNGDGSYFANELYDTGEDPIPGITVTLYISTTHGWVEWATTTSDANGEYTFDDLPDGEYRIDVGSVQDTHYGWTNTTETSLYVDLDKDHATTDPVTSGGNDFGFAPALTLDKALIGPSPAEEDQLVSYTIELNNILPGNGTAVGSACQYYVWAGHNHLKGSGDDPESNDTWLPKYDESAALGAPDGAYTESTMNSQGDDLGLGGFLLDQQLGNITGVTARLYLRERVEIETIQYLDYHLYIDDNDITTQTVTFDSTYFNQTAPATYVFDVDLSAVPWTWSHFANDRTEALLVGRKDGGNPAGIVGLDAIAYVITTDQTCGGDQPNTTIDPLPMTDTYDADKLTFYSADPVQTSVTTGGSSPYDNTGSIYWNNLGPLYAGGTKFITVTFRVQDGIAPTTITNTATVDNAYFSNGNPTNDATDYVTNTVQQTARLGDWVWNDTNGDGVQDSGELGIPGVVITLTANVTITIDGVDYAPGTEITTTTDADGYYLFTGLRDGTYTVEVDTSTLPGTTFTPTVDFDNDGNDDNDTTVVVSGGTVTSIGGQACTGCELDVDFGYQIPNTIIGTVWHDHDGLDEYYYDRDPGDEGFGDVTVNLEWWNGTTSTWEVIATTQTYPDGSYIFSDLPDGDYRVVVDASTLPYASSVTWDQTVDPDLVLDDTSGTYSLSGGELVTYVDFAYHEEGDYTLGGTVYADWNDNADLDAGEPGFSGITVDLYSSSGAFITTTTTNASGVYTFTGLITDTYTVVVDRSGIPSQYDETEDYDERPDACLICDNQAATVVVNATYSSVTDVDFGYFGSGTGAIGDTVWRDMNGDGIQAGPQETGIAGITVTLQIDLNGDGNWTTVETAVTDENGNYLFENLPDGSYRVLVDATAEGIPEGPGGFTYVPSTATTQNATISGGNTYLDADFGFKPLAVVGDMVYYDANISGDQDWNETGIPGVEVRLYNDTDQTVTIGGVEVAPGGYISTTTNADPDNGYPIGWYQFTGLETGSTANPFTYTVEVVTTLSQTADPDRDGVPCGVSDPDLTACDNETTVLVYPGTIFLGADFGYQASGVIGDYVWYDGDGDGVQDAGEPGIAGLVITATNGTTVYTTTTDYDGLYTFANLPDDTWTITVGDYEDGTPFALTPTLSNTNAIANGVGSMGGTSVDVTLSGGIVTAIDLDQDNVPDITPADCGGCSLDLNIDFGFRDVGEFSISGTVFYDFGGTTDTLTDTYTNTLDTPYEGVIVYLWKDGILVGTTTTASDGSYTFDELPAGDYVVSVNPDAPVFTGLDLTASPTAGSNYELVTVGPNAEDVDFGFWDPTPTAVTLAGFWATARDGTILLSWETVTEIDNLGFNLYRAESIDGARTRLNAELIPGQMPGSPAGAFYEQVDATVQLDVDYYYWLEAVDLDQHTDLYGPVSAKLAPVGPFYRVFLPIVVK